MGSNIKYTLEQYISNEIDGKCINEGYIKPNSIQIISYSNGVVNNTNIRFDVVIECKVCSPVEGAIINCVVKNITKAGIKAEVNETPTPVVIFVARDHNYMSKNFSTIKENQEISKLKDIRWVVEDALKFVSREVKRGRKYQGIILDPPAYGIGAKGERWKLEEKLGLLLQEVAKLLDDKGFLVLNVYSLGLSPYIIQNLMTDYFSDREVDISELCLKSRTEQILPLGIVARI